MKKKNIKVKKGNGDISITIENNLNANNKQINHQPIKRKRRKKKVENNDETLQQSLQELPPLKDVSYIKPGPIGNFKVWRDTMDSCGRCATGDAWRAGCRCADCLRCAGWLHSRGAL